MPFFENLISQLVAALGVNMLNLLAAVGILIGGWIVALIIAAVVRGVLARTTTMKMASRPLENERKSEFSAASSTLATSPSRTRSSPTWRTVNAAKASGVCMSVCASTSTRTSSPSVAPVA